MNRKTQKPELKNCPFCGSDHIELYGPSPEWATDWMPLPEAPRSE